MNGAWNIGSRFGECMAVSLLFALLNLTAWAEPSQRPHVVIAGANDRSDEHPEIVRRLGKSWDARHRDNQNPKLSPDNPPPAGPAAGAAR